MDKELISFLENKQKYFEQADKFDLTKKSIKEYLNTIEKAKEEVCVSPALSVAAEAVREVEATVAYQIVDD